MKEYEIIQPPFTTLCFKEMSKEDLKKYYKWYLDIMPKRLNLLIDVVKSFKDYESWKSDYSPESLEKLGQWFYENVETRKRTGEEKDDIYSKSPDWFKTVEIQDWELTNKTFSLSIDIGMYLANVFLKNNYSLKWDHFTKGKKIDIDYGQPVLIGFGSDTFNPTHISITLAYGLARKNKTGNRLKELYDTWIKFIK
ncbi:MAG: hypothetical protein A2355_15975 [Spirochaetes bacterium RIFOXYB1_FULL_32_8]|nr:MAG: hypothetical protein A2355_15975 [Spirochaetes bacterium RIFOXYB1_FULL_32_8]